MGARRDSRSPGRPRGDCAPPRPELELHHMLRLLHSRYPVYIVPRAEGQLVVGATTTESDDPSPISVRGALSFCPLPILCSPLWPKRAPRIQRASAARPAGQSARIRFDCKRNALHINGLYRHGFLLTPSIVEEVLALDLQEPSADAGRVCVRTAP